MACDTLRARRKPRRVKKIVQGWLALSQQIIEVFFLLPVFWLPLLFQFPQSNNTNATCLTPRLWRSFIYKTVVRTPALPLVFAVGHKPDKNLVTPGS